MVQFPAAIIGPQLITVGEPARNIAFITGFFSAYFADLLPSRQAKPFFRFFCSWLHGLMRDPVFRGKLMVVPSLNTYLGFRKHMIGVSPFLSLAEGALLYQIKERCTAHQLFAS